MKFSALLAVGWLLTTSIAAPTNITLTNVTLSEYYVDATAEQHQQYFKTWKAAGHKIISLSVYGQPPNTRYAAVWSQNSESPWVGIHDANSSVYQEWFDKYSTAGYASTLISATGPSDSPVYAGVMEQFNTTNWYQKCSMTSNTTNGEFWTGTNNKMKLTSFTEYGSSQDRLYCGIWHSNEQFDKYSFAYENNYANYSTTKVEETSKPHWRPAYQSVSEDHFISATFTDTDVGSWDAKHGLDASTLAQEISTQKLAGRTLRQLEGAGTGSNVQFAALFTAHSENPRTFRAIGSSTGFQDNNGAEAAADIFMKDFMQKNGVRQAQLSVGKNGSIILEKAYSWNEESRRTTQTNDTFLLASLSKMFLAASIQSLYDANLLNASSRVYPLLGYTSTTDARAQDITVDQCIQHTAGYDRGVSGDPAYMMLTISQALGKNTPASVTDIVDYMANTTLDYTPGEGYAYGNYNYILLSYLVERLSNMSYYDYLRANILEPGNHDVRKWGSYASEHEDDHVVQESRNVGGNPLKPGMGQYERIAAVFGGDGMVKESALGTVSLATSASTLVRFISRNAVYNIGPRPTFQYPGSTQSRSGTTDGANTWAESRWDGVDWAVTVNTRDWPAYGQWENPFEDVLCGTTVRHWLDEWGTV